MILAEWHVDPVEKLKEHLRCPSVSTDSKFKEGMDGSRRFLEGLFTDMGLCVEVVNTPMHPIVLARREGDPEWPHVLIYGHYDVQPADPLGEWQSDPFDPVVKDGGSCKAAADNKGPQMAHLRGSSSVEKSGIAIENHVSHRGEEE